MKQRIEFYQAALKPATDAANLRFGASVAMAIVAIWLLVFANGAINAYQLQQQNQALVASINAGQQNVAQLQVALSELNNRKDDGEQVKLEQNIRARQQLLRLLNQQNLVSYASTLNDLAHIPWQDVALQGLTLQGKQMVLRGVAAKASAVPAWILGFENSSSLRGHSFGQLSISQDEEGVLNFSLYSSEVSP